MEKSEFKLQINSHDYFSYDFLDNHYNKIHYEIALNYATLVPYCREENFNTYEKIIKNEECRKFI